MTILSNTFSFILQNRGNPLHLCILWLTQNVFISLIFVIKINPINDLKCYVSKKKTFWRVNMKQRHNSMYVDNHGMQRLTPSLIKLVIWPKLGLLYIKVSLKFLSHSSFFSHGIPISVKFESSLFSYNLERFFFLLTSCNLLLV